MSKAKYYQQASLQHKHTFITCWIPIEKGVREGSRIKIKGDDRWWSIDTLYNKKVNAKKLSEKQKMDNDFGGSIK